MTLREYFETRFQLARFKADGERTARYRRALAFIEEHFGNDPARLDVRRITDDDLQQMVSAAIERGYAPVTCKLNKQRLRSILRHARPVEFPKTPVVITFPQPPAEPLNPNMQLVVYMRHAYYAGRELSRSHELEMFSAINKLTEFLGYPARLRDLTDNNVVGMAHLCGLQGRAAATIRRRQEYIRALWRHAIANGLAYGGELTTRSRSPGSGRKKGVEQLTNEDGTLWHLCQSRFFPANVRITAIDTKKQYELALRCFKRHLGHEPVLADLQDDVVIGWLVRLRDESRLSKVTINERVGRVITFWTWAAKKRLVEEFPFVPKLKEPKRVPRAWTRAEMDKLFVAARNVRGVIDKFSAADWWHALLSVLWDTGERIGAIMATRWAWLDWGSGVLSIPAEVRKGGERDMVYTLHTDTLVALKRIYLPDQEKIFHWSLDRSCFHGHYKAIVEAAGLPYEFHQSGFHKIRRTHASYLQRAGIDACAVLQHSTPAVTIASYLDPTITGTVRPSEVLFRPGQEGGGV